jgi:short-subunit dehydrogenase
MPDGHFPRFLARSAERVAREGYEGLMRGKSVVVPGAANKIATVLPRLLPRGAVPRMIRSFQRWRRGI